MTDREAFDALHKGVDAVKKLVAQARRQAWEECREADAKVATQVAESECAKDVSDQYAEGAAYTAEKIAAAIRALEMPQ